MFLLKKISTFSYRTYSDQENDFNICFKNKIRGLIEKNIKCKTALIHGLNLSSEIPFCPNASVSKQMLSAIVDTFMREMQHFEELGCPMPCSLSPYKAELMLNHENAMELYTGLKNSQHFLLYLYYYSMESEVDSESLIIDFTNLIASVGGNLGLFLGFSCLTVYWLLLDLLKKKLK